jgi:phosphate uptake regulator
MGRLVDRTISGAMIAGHSRDLRRMAQSCRDQVGDILAPVVARDVGRARLVAARDDRIDRVYHRLFDEFMELSVAPAVSPGRGFRLAWTVS